MREHLENGGSLSESKMRKIKRGHSVTGGLKMRVNVAAHTRHIFLGGAPGVGPFFLKFFYLFFFFFFTFENDRNLFWVYQNGNFLPGKSISQREKNQEKMTLPPQKNMSVICYAPAGKALAMPRGGG